MGRKKKERDEHDDGFPEKWRKLLPTGFADDVASASNDDLKKSVFQSETNIYALEKEMEMDEKLSGAKALVKDLSQPYTETKAAQKAKIKYCLFLLGSRGVSLERDDKEEKEE